MHSEFLTVAYSIFLMNFVFGLLVKAHIIDSSRFRRVHHMLYFLVMGSILAAAVIGFIEDPAWGWFPATMAALLLGMALFRGNSRAHWVYATICLGIYSAIVFWH